MIADKSIADVTLADIDKRFTSNSWAMAGGNAQSLLFACTALRYIPSHIFELMGKPDHATLIDYGCAEGDGTAVLAAHFPPVTVMGCDISAAAIAHAQARWPRLSFYTDDIRNPHYKADCIWTSHTLEHLVDPASVVKELRSRCKLLIVIVPPIESEDQRAGGPHVDAKFTSAWLSELDAPLYRNAFTVHRRDIPYNGVLLKEDSLILIWKGL